jgi:hypothetical protein
MCAAMMKEQVIIQTISINKRSQQNFFQVKLPRDTHKIIGIETGLNVLNVPGYFIPAKELSKLIRRNNLMGVVQLRANTKPDVFYSKEIFERDMNIGADEIKNIPTPQVDEWKEREISLMATALLISLTGHTAAKREEDPLDICGCTVINGQYKDAIGEYFRDMM